VLTLEDVTDELRTERILAWGEVAQQVAHEVKNPLTPIKLGVQHILRAWEDERPDYDEILRRNVDAVLEEIDRLAGIASSFSRFGAPTASTTGPLEAVPVAEVVGEVLDLYRAGEGPVEFDFVGEEGLPPVRARRGELKEVLVNLLENARTALPEGGAVSVEAFGANGKVDLRVRDNGSGIPPDLLPRVFEPHFSTRSGGTGLGLAIVRRLVESWGGTVRVESGPGTGTVVHIGLWRWRDEWIDPRDRPPRGGVVPADS
jgi:two-component system nitrogen regulation sensor histidine kinase NtrY